MNPFEKISAMAMSGLRVQAHRMQVATENIANADTHGYQRKLVTFENVYDRESDLNRVEIGRLSLDRTPGERLFDPNHPFADGEGYVTMSNVNIMTEFADAREANRSYDAGLQMYKEARSMYGSLLDILRN